MNTAACAPTFSTPVDGKVGSTHDIVGEYPFSPSVCSPQPSARHTLPRAPRLFVSDSPEARKRDDANTRAHARYRVPTRVTSNTVALARAALNSDSEHERER